MATYTVKKGDTLSQIAVDQYGTYGSSYSSWKTYMDYLVKLNNIKDPNFIVIGQSIKLNGDVPKATTNKTSKAQIVLFGLQSNPNADPSYRTVYATWKWSKDYTENYEVQWEYDTGDKTWFVGNKTTVDDNQDVYTAPDNAKKVRFRVKPISKKKTVNKKEVNHWTASWCSWKTYNFSDNPPTKPGTPSVEIKNYTLTASLVNVNVNATNIQFQIVKDDNSVYKTGNASIITNAASYSCTVAAGAKYKVRARAYRANMYSAWSEYSNNITTIPATPSGFTSCKASSETSVILEWKKVTSAESYDIEYATKKEYFDSSDKTQTTTGITTLKYEKTGLESGQEYFFRIRSVNSAGTSGWSEIKSIVLGTDPAAPTTWSSTTTVTTGEELILYWVHNSEDGSSQTYAELELIIGGTSKTYTIKNSTDEDEKDKTSTYTIDTSGYVEGTKIQWRVRTAGITNKYGDWSIQRTIDVYAPATLELNVTDNNGEDLETLSAFPFYISGLAGPNTQVPTGYHVSVIANETYETVDAIGNEKIVSEGDEVYSKYFDISDRLVLEMSAGHIDLANDISYTVKCIVSMNSGLTAESSVEFTVVWSEDEDVYEPDAEIGIDEETLSAYIRPHCWDEDVTLSVYRREFDGTFTEIATGIVNGSNTYVTDPHPALDYARYRIVATATANGAVSYYDVPGYPVGEPAVIIQWDEKWSSFDTENEDEMDTPAWSGSMLKLPYNIDVSDSYKSDVSLINYQGRKRPVSYYGTQLGESSTWNMVIPKDDKETLYALRRLAIYTGDVYVREPSGTGYWANISVSFSQKHKDLTIPITIGVTRVEGGI